VTAVDPAATFSVDLDALGVVGSGSHRPECVLCPAHGDVYVAIDDPTGHRVSVSLMEAPEEPPP
jgi:hypothetical protein